MPWCWWQHCRRRWTDANHTSIGSPTGHKADAQRLKLAHRQALLLSSTKLAGTFSWIEAHRMVNNWGRSFVRATGGMQLYDLRHAGAVRSIHKGLNALLAARCLGHSLSVHSDTYHRYMNAADVAAVAAGLQ